MFRIRLDAETNEATAIAIYGRAKTSSFGYPRGDEYGLSIEFDSSQELELALTKLLETCKRNIKLEKSLWQCEQTQIQLPLG